MGLKGLTMTDTTHRLDYTIRYVTEAKLTRWSDDGRPFEDHVWTPCPDTYVAGCTCGRTVSAATEGAVLAAFSDHVAHEARTASQGVTA